MLHEWGGAKLSGKVDADSMRRRASVSRTSQAQQGGARGTISSIRQPPAEARAVVMR